ncbi:hypothetical protein [Massilia sp. TSP1-1-2]|uniref:hypothetical protein n=1 Tax=Massilia sp. TSP1-1-2 TaxID=2804649 RepID=UPI003CECFD69
MPLSRVPPTRFSAMSVLACALLPVLALYCASTGATTTGSLGAARMYHQATAMPEPLKIDTATLLENGNVILTSPTSRNLMHYQSATGAWNVTGPKRAATRDTSVTRLSNGKLLLAGGAALNDATASAALWDPACAPQKLALPLPAQGVDGDGGALSWTVTGAPGCHFDAADLPAWLTRVTGEALEMAAEGSLAVGFMAAPNTTGSPRTASFMLGNETATLTQPSVPAWPSMPTFSPTYALKSCAATGAISVSAAPSCPWRISALPGFVTATSSLGGKGNGSVSYAVAANGGAARSGQGRIDALDMSGAFTMNQEAAPLCPSAPALSLTSAALTAGGGSGAVSVSAAASCPWHVGALPSWVTLTVGADGTGDGSFSFSVGANNGAARSANGAVTGPGVSSTFGLSQASAGAPGACTNALGSALPSSGTLQASACSACARGANLYTDRYTFSSMPGRQVTILLTSSAFDTYLFLRDPSGVVIKSDDDGGGGTNSHPVRQRQFYLAPPAAAACTRLKCPAITTRAAALTASVSTSEARCRFPCSTVQSMCMDPAMLFSSSDNHRRASMGKYVLGWILGIPAVVLVVIYLIAN